MMNQRTAFQFPIFEFMTYPNVKNLVYVIRNLLHFVRYIFNFYYFGLFLLGVATASQLFRCNAGGVVRRGSFVVSPGLSFLLWFDLMILGPFTLVPPETEC